MRTKIAATAILGLAMLAASPAAAVTSFLSNFDGTTFASGVTNVASIDGWTGGALGIDVHADGIDGAPRSGANLVELDTSANSSMSRAIDAGIYTLTFGYSAAPGAAITSTGIAIYSGSTLLTTVSSNGLNRNGSPKTNTSWLTYTANFTAQEATSLRFAAIGTSDGIGGFLDNVQLVGTALPVPEPGEWAMIVAGLGVIGMAARRRIAR